MNETTQATYQILADRMAAIEALALDKGAHNVIDLAKLQALFRYEDGALVRCVTVTYNAEAGKVAGTIDRSTGYVKVNFDGKVRLVHRLVWALVHKTQPPKQIDHRDGNRSNNRIENLRACTSSQNLMNRRACGSKKFKGVTFHKGAGKFAAQIVVNKLPVYLGLYEREEDAARAYDAACVANFGEFARPNFNGAAL